jgi:Xaa-Pro aminopeptidase
MIKSPLEIERIKKAALITCKAYERAWELIKEGMTEIEIADIFRKTMIEEGSKLYPEHAFFNIRAGKERYPMADSLCQERKIQRGEMLVLDCGCTYKGYWTDLCRVAHVGKPTSEHKRAYRTVVEALNAAVDHLKPGIKAKEIYEAAHRIIEAAKCGVTLDMVGHGIGLDLHEPPVLGLGIDTTLKPGMVLCVEPWIYDVFDKGIFACEDMFVITEKKCELLSPLPREELWTVE